MGQNEQNASGSQFQWARVQVVKDGQVIVQTGLISVKELSMVQSCLQVLHGLESVRVVRAEPV